MRTRTSRRADTRWALRSAAAIVAVAALAIPAAALAGPATDEYSLDLPDAKGEKGSAERPPQTDAGALPPDVAAELRDDPQGKALAAIATADELGSPAGAGSASGGPGGDGSGSEDETAGDDTTTLSAAAGSLDDPGVAGLLIAIALMTGVFLLVRSRSGRGTS